MGIVRTIRLVVVAAFFLLAPRGARARVTCIRLTSEHVADTTDLGRFRQFHRWKDKTGNALALAIWQYLSDTETGLYHFNEILEGPDPFDEFATVRDPLKILNTYNMAYCGIFGPVLDGIYQGVGFEKGRSFGLQAWNHCATEVWYDEKWHYLDLDVRGALLDGDGVVASLAQAQRHRGLWVDPPVEVQPFFPKDPDKAKLFEIYKNSPVDYYYRWFQRGHTMDFSLRQGESLTRFWRPQGGRWRHLRRYGKVKWIADLIETEPRGAKPNHREFTRWDHGNGRFDYRPRLTSDFTDFEDGYYAVDNLRPGAKGLEIVRDGAAEVTFEVFTPYVIVAKVNDLDEAGDDEEASVVTVGGPLLLEVWVSLDHGLTWTTAGRIAAGGTTATDLTAQVTGTYGYLVKFKTAGPAGATALETLEIKTWVQVAPASLPALKRGKTTFRYEIGDRYGRRTLPMLVTPNTADPNDLARYVVRMPRDYDPKRHTCRIRGDVIVRLAAPPRTRISWFTVGGTFRTHQGKQAEQTDNRVAYAVSEPENFREIYRSDVPSWVNHWRYNWDGDVLLGAPADVVYVRYTAHTGLNTIRACLHLRPDRAAEVDLNVRHEYRVDGRLRSTEKWLAGPGSYAINCDGEPENVSIRLETPHGKR